MTVFCQSPVNPAYVFAEQHVKNPEMFNLVAVIDPEDAEAVKRLADAMRVAATEDGQTDLAAALRQFAKPRPKEPTGLGAVVEDSDGWHWVRVDDPPHSWVRSLRDEAWASHTQRSRWQHIDAVRVLSEGVQP